MQNLDLKCANLGRELARNANEKILTEALSVLEEQGVYAFFLFLHANDQRETIGKHCIEFLQHVPEGDPLLTEGNEFDALKTLAKDLDRLLFARDLLRQALVYGRYHAKGSGQSA